MIYRVLIMNYSAFLMLHTQVEHHVQVEYHVAGMQPFARAIQHAIDLPIFSWGTLLDYAYSVISHREYYGHV